MKPFISLLACMVIAAAAGCSNDESVKEFNFESEAIEYGMKESPEIKEIIGESKYVGDEKVLVYLFKNETGTGTGTATLVQNKDKVKWVINGPGVVVQQPEGNVGASHTFETPSGLKFELYSGVAENQNVTVETKIDYGVKPHVHEESTIYYYLSAVPGK
ncbi:hypothetical protein GKZ89_15930 [Bacillus mangrovi]|uniref:Uncharacterized protein n=1 Tax=Metabacillus mangrovi TaxID=1491830 RepID=A0A7X2S7N7_9BACI|nr:hypothetical protein [Metabacillus mangrovi]MTH54892.1 hypothetical protein [Metabacillus mangrovi]